DQDDIGPCRARQFPGEARIGKQPSQNDSQARPEAEDLGFVGYAMPDVRVAFHHVSARELEPLNEYSSTRFARVVGAPAENAHGVSLPGQRIRLTLLNRAPLPAPE